MFSTRSSLRSVFRANCSILYRARRFFADSFPQGLPESKQCKAQWITVWIKSKYNVGSGMCSQVPSGVANVSEMDENSSKDYPILFLALLKETRRFCPLFSQSASVNTVCLATHYSHLYKGNSLYSNQAGVGHFPNYLCSKGQWYFSA